MSTASSIKAVTELERTTLRSVLARGEGRWNECPCGWFYNGTHCPDEHCKHRQVETEELGIISLLELMDRIAVTYKRATWESPENFSDQPNHPHVRLGQLLVELRRRIGIPGGK